MRFFANTCARVITIIKKLIFSEFMENNILKIRNKTYKIRVYKSDMVDHLYKLTMMVYITTTTTITTRHINRA